MEEKPLEDADFDAEQAMAQLDTALRCVPSLHESFERLLDTGFVPCPIALSRNALAWPLPRIRLVAVRNAARERLYATGLVSCAITLGRNALAWPLPGICLVVVCNAARPNRSH